ncbi:hypothetical protein P0D72_36990 [Paraburkholderia sediminicola]|uniref:hypothetical protein n=1 Tax=Paraburkholderia sediminicola TaxID=458836 RepID=UPI0038BB3EFC
MLFFQGLALVDGLLQQLFRQRLVAMLYVGKRLPVGTIDFGALGGRGVELRLAFLGRRI